MECRQVNENRRLVTQVEIAMSWVTVYFGGGGQKMYNCDGSLTIPARPYDRVGELIWAGSTRDPVLFVMRRRTE